MMAAKAECSDELSTLSLNSQAFEETVAAAEKKTHDVDIEAEYDYTILVIGVTGAGKSTLCNFFFQREVFETGSGIVSITESTVAHAHSLHGKSILFIDTPGFSDTYESEEEHMNEMAKALVYARNGVNAIIICINGAHRFDKASSDLVNELELLGAFWPYAILAFTKASVLGKNEDQRKTQITKWIGQHRCPQKFRDLMEHTKNRYMTFAKIPHIMNRNQKNL